MLANHVAPQAPATKPFVLNLRGAKQQLLIYHRANAAGLVTSGPIALYALITKLALEKDRAWTETPARELAKQLDVHERSITRWFKDLVDCGWIQRRSIARADGTLETARTTVTALRRDEPAPTPKAASQHERIAPPQAREALAAIDARPELRNYADAATRHRVRAEIVWSWHRGWLARLESDQHRVNTAMQMVRDRTWRSPRDMPTDFPALLARELPAEFGRTATVVQLPTREPVPRNPDVAARTPGIAEFNVASILKQLGVPTDLSDNKSPLGITPKGGYSAPPLSTDAGRGG